MPDDKPLRGVIPNDLPKVEAFKHKWPLDKRIEAARAAVHTDGKAYTQDEQMIAVAVTCNEQPVGGWVYVNNACGFMCWGQKSPWGWKSWVKPPVGYALIPEGAGGKMGVFLAFASVDDSLLRVLAAVRVRLWASAPDWAAFYADRWVAVPELRKESISGFNAAMLKVRAAWPAQADKPK